MSRIDTITHQELQITLPVTYDRRKSRFACSFGSQFFENSDIAVLKEAVLCAIEASAQMSWRPVLIVMSKATPHQHRIGSTVREDDSYHSVHLSLMRERRYIGYHPSLGYKQVTWDAAPESRLQVAQPFPWEGVLTLPHQHERAGALFTYLDYDEETWETLERIQAYLAFAAMYLNTHIGQREAIITLAALCEQHCDGATAPLHTERSKETGTANE